DMANTLLMMIDLENLSMVVRGMKQGRSRGFLEAVLSDDGTFEEVELVDLATSKDYNRVLDKFASLPFASKINDSISANDPIDVVQLDKKIKKSRLKKFVSQLGYHLAQCPYWLTFTSKKMK